VEEALDLAGFVHLVGALLHAADSVHLLEGIGKGITSDLSGGLWSLLQLVELVLVLEIA
jgi:hypothetical protein